MIIAALNEFKSSEEVVPFGFARKRNLGFVLVLYPDALDCELTTTYQPNDRGRPAAPEAVVPNLIRTSGISPMLGCDTAAYVLRRPKQAKDEGGQAKEDRAAAAKQEAFLGLLRGYGAETRDADVEIYEQWVVTGMPGLEEQVAGLDAYSAKRLDLDLVAIRVQGSTRIHDKPAARTIWARVAEGAKASGAQGLCLSCGLPGALVDSLPQALAGTAIPGTSTSQVALLSANFPAASRGASGTGLKSAPICTTCAAGAVTAFNTLASRGKHRWDLGDRAAAIWWATQDSIDDFIESLSTPDPKLVKNLLKSVEVGRASPARIPGRFYLLTFSGNVARLVIRRFLEFPLAAAAANVAEWFEDSRTCHVDRPYRPIWAIAASAGPFPTTGDAELPDGSFEALLMTALAKEQPPRALLGPAVARAKAEASRLNADGLEGWRARERAADRLALFRVILSRSRTEGDPAMAPGLDEDRAVPAYISGRLFATRQALQRAALGDVNASIVDRYFPRASANPASVEHALSTLEQQHLRALRRKGGEGAAVRLGSQIQRLHDRIGVAPGRLGVAEQAEWIAGYYQQREHDIQTAIAGKKANEAAKTQDSEDD